jgi:hypothetical protein
MLQRQKVIYNKQKSDYEKWRKHAKCKLQTQTKNEKSQNRNPKSYYKGTKPSFW